MLPRFTTTEPGPEFSASQLAFAAVASLALYAMFVFTQTVRHRDFFLPVDADGGRHDDGPRRARRPADRTGPRWSASALLLVALVAVVGLAKVESPAIEDAVAAAGLPARRSSAS